MTSLAARAVKAYSRRMIKAKPRSAEHLLKHIRRALNHTPVPPIVPPGVRKRTFSARGVQGRLLGVRAPQQAMLFLHGGGYVAGVTRTYIPLCGKFAKALNADVYLPDYRLAPEHPYPAALEDALTGYEMLLERFPPERITVAGDSAGGGLALSTLLALRDAGRPLPACGVAYSPFTDLTNPGGSRVTNSDSCNMFTAETFSIDPYLYARTDSECRHPHASPVFGDFRGLPPLLITVEETECLRDDAHRVADKAREDGAQVELIARSGLLHVWPIFYPFLPEARQDVQATIRFIDTAVQTVARSESS